MNAFVNILKYLLILVLFAIGAFIVLGGALVLFPSFKLFGLHYISGDKQVTATSYDLTTEEGADIYNAEVLKFITNAFDVKIRPIRENDALNENTVTVMWHRFLTGFVYGDVDFPEWSTRTATDNGKAVVIFEVKEPQGLIFKTDACLEIVMAPQAFENKDIYFESNSGNFSIGENYAVKKDNEQEIKTSQTSYFKSLNINGGTGDVNVLDVSLGGNAIINKKGGLVNFETNLYNDTIISITDKLGKIYLKDIGSSAHSANLTMNGVSNSHIKFGTVYGDVVLTAGGGLLQGKEIKGKLAITSNSCEVSVEKVGNNITVQGKEGTIDVKEALGNVTIEQTSGAVRINKISGTSNLKTTRGEIKIGEALKAVVVESEYGNIDISGNGTNKFDFVVNAKHSKVTLNKVNGSVKFKALENGSASASVGYSSLSGQNYFLTNTGNISLTIQGNTPFWLEWSTAKKASVTLPGFRSTEKKNEEGAGIFGADSNSANSLIITTISGEITVNS